MNTAAKVIGIGLGVLIAFILIVAFQGWIIMLLAGALFPLWSWPTLSFGDSVLIGLGLSLVGSFFRGTRK